MMDIGAIMKIKGAWEQFCVNHPKFMPWLTAVSKKGVTEGTIIEIAITTPDGEKLETNLKVQQSDLDLLNTISQMK